METYNNIIICVGRRIGAGGLSTAKMLSEQLGIQLFDRNLLAESARQYGLDPEIFEKRDEKKSWKLKSLFGMNNNLIIDEEMFKMQSDVMRRIASTQSCIFVGRCADYVLRDYPNVFSVFITAPLECRVRRMAEILGCSGRDALRYIEKTESGRASYYNYYTFKKWGDSASYDLCVNSQSAGSIENTVEIIKLAMRKAGFAV